MAVVSALRASLWEARSAGVEAHASQVVSISTMADEVFDVETRLHCARVAQKIVRHQARDPHSHLRRHPFTPPTT